MVKTTVEINDEVWKAIVLRADREEMTRSGALEKILREWASNHEEYLSEGENRIEG